MELTITARERLLLKILLLHVTDVLDIMSTADREATESLLAKIALPNDQVPG